MTYPCATSPSCGVDHHGPDDPVHHVGWHTIHHAERYLTLLAKLRDREAMAKYSAPFDYEPLLAYLEVTPCP